MEKRGIEIYLPLFPHDEKYKQISERFKYAFQQKGNILDIYYYNYMEIKIYSVDCLPLKKILKMKLVIIIIGPLFSNNH